ncbi:MAG: DUF2141 domain-containing protein [Blastomonas sp.]
MNIARAIIIGGVALAMLPAAAPVSTLTVEVDQLRSSKGLLQLCLTRDKTHFPDCQDDPEAFRRTVDAASPHITFAALPVGDYALSVVHDENANSRLDTFAGIPREGVGFSRNPRFTFGPPKFTNALFSASQGAVSQRVKIKYFL